MSNWRLVSGPGMSKGRHSIFRCGWSCRPVTSEPVSLWRVPLMLLHLWCLAGMVGQTCETLACFLFERYIFLNAENIKFIFASKFLGEMRKWAINSFLKYPLVPLFCLFQVLACSRFSSLQLSPSEVVTVHFSKHTCQSFGEEVEHSAVRGLKDNKQKITGRSQSDGKTNQVHFSLQKKKSDVSLST